MVIYTICIVVDANKSFIAQKKGSKNMSLNEEFAQIEPPRKGCLPFLSLLIVSIVLSIFLYFCNNYVVQVY